MKTTILNGKNKIARKVLTAFTLISLLVSCGNDVTSVDMPASQEKLVSFSFFSSEIDSLSKASATSRADPSGVFNFLRVTFFDASSNTIVKDILQVPNTEGETFGTFKIRLPYGSYKMVAIANNGSAKANMESPQKVTFANNTAVKTQYAVCDVTVNQESSTTINSQMAWGNTSFLLKNTDDAKESTPTVGKVVITISGKCGNEFNPQTGYAIDQEGITRTYPNTNTHIPSVNAYAFLASDEEKVSVTCEFYDKDVTKAIRTLKFDNVVLKKGYVTTYTGPFLTKNNDVTIQFASTTMPSSGADETFE